MFLKNKKLAGVIIFVVAMGLFVAIVAPVLAQANTFGLPNRPLSAIIDSMINWLLGIATGMAILFLIVGGIYYVTARGNDSQIEQARKIINYAVLGLVVVGISYSIVKVIDKIIKGG